MSLQTVEKKEVYVKALFDYDACLDSGLPSKGLSFRYGDIIHVTNATDPEWWQARLLITHPAADRPWEENLGIIPSKRRVERKERKRINQVKFSNAKHNVLEFKESNPPNQTNEPTKKESSRKKKNRIKMSRKFPFMKSIEDVSKIDNLNGSHSTSLNQYKEAESIAESESVGSERGDDGWILSYEAIAEQDINYMRPIVILGPLKDRIMEDLVGDYPEKFGVCIPHTTRQPRPGEVDGAVGNYYFVDKEEMEKQQKMGYFFEVGVHNNNLYGTSINSVIDVSKSGLHCVLDVRGDAIRELQKKSLYPIAIYIKPKISNRTRAPLIDDQVTWLQEMNKRLTREACIKIIEQAERTEAEFADCFTAAVTGNSMHDIYKGVLDVIEMHGQSTCWLPSGESL